MYQALPAIIPGCVLGDRFGSAIGDPGERPSSRQAKVENLHPIVRGQENVRGFDVAMDDPA
jgi:hypothetical protein